MKFWILIFGFLHGNRGLALFNGVPKGLKAANSFSEAEALYQNLSVPLEGAQKTPFFVRDHLSNLFSPERLKYLALLQQQGQKTEHLNNVSGYHYRKQSLPSPNLHPNSKLLNESNFDQKNFQYFARKPQVDLFNPENDYEKTADLLEDHALDVFLKAIYKNAKRLLETNHPKRKSATDPASSQEGYVYPIAGGKSPEDYSKLIENLNQSVTHIDYPEEIQDINSTNCRGDAKNNVHKVNTFNDEVHPVTNAIQSMQNNIDAMQKNFQSEQIHLQSSLHGHQSTPPSDQFGRLDGKRTKSNDPSHPGQQSAQFRGQSIPFTVPQTHSNRQSLESHNQPSKLGSQSRHKDLSLKRDDILLKYNGLLVPQIEQSSYLHSQPEGQATQFGQSILFKGQSTESYNQATPHGHQSIQYSVRVPLFHDQPTQTGDQPSQYFHQSVLSNAHPIQSDQKPTQFTSTQSNPNPQSNDQLSQFNSQSTQSSDLPLQSDNQKVLHENQLNQFSDPSQRSFVNQLRKLLRMLLQNYDQLGGLQSSAIQSIIASNQPVDFHQVPSKVNEKGPKQIDDHQQDDLGARTIFSNNLVARPSLLPSPSQPSFLPVVELNNVWKPIIKGQSKPTEAPFIPTPSTNTEAGQRNLNPQQQHHQLKDYHSQFAVPSTAVNSQQLLELLNTDHSNYPVHQPHFTYGAPHVEINATHVNKLIGGTFHQ